MRNKSVPRVAPGRGTGVEVREITAMARPLKTRDAVRIPAGPPPISPATLKQVTGKTPMPSA